MAEGFRDGARWEVEQNELVKLLYAKIGEPTMERDFFKSIGAMSRWLRWRRTAQ